MEKYSCPVSKSRMPFTEKQLIYAPIANEKILILNQRAFNGMLDISDTRIIFDRRTSEHDNDQEGRGRKILNSSR